MPHTPSSPASSTPWESHAWPLILASASPRRAELLTQAGYAFQVIPSEVNEDCGLCSGESPPDFVGKLALQKALDVARRIERGIVIGCDTVAEWGGQIIGKPANEEHARRILQTLRGRDHRVYTGLCLIRVPGGKPMVRVAVTRLVMDDLSDAQIEEYLAGGHWEGKAGAFGYQDRLGWVHIVEGSESNVVGLPLELLEEMLQVI